MHSKKASKVCCCYPSLAHGTQPNGVPCASPFIENEYTILITHIWENDTPADRPDFILISLYWADTAIGLGELVGDYYLIAQDNWESVVKVSEPGYYYATASVSGYKTTESDRIVIPSNIPPEYDGLIWENPNQNNPFGSANYFSAFIFGDVSVQGADVESGLAARGNFSSAAGFTVGLPWSKTGGHSFVGLPIAPHNPRFLLGGSITAVQNLDVFGGTIVLSEAATYPLSAIITAWEYIGDNEFYSEADRNYFVPTGLPNSITRATSAKINQFFSDGEASLKALSQSFSDLSTGGNIYVVDVPPTAWVGDGYKDLYLNNILPFDFDYSLYDTIVFNIIAPATSTAVSNWASTVMSFPESFSGRYILNILPYAGVTTLNIVAGSTIINGANRLPDIYGDTTVWELARRYSDRIVLNFPDSSLNTITTSANELIGSVLAPNSDFRPSGGAVNGTLVARSVVSTGGWEVHSTTYFGRIRPRASYDGELQIISTRQNLPAPVPVYFTANKNAVGAPLPDGRFTIGVFENELLVATGINDASGNVNFTPVKIEAPGIYQYIIREITVSGGGWTVDDRNFSAVITATLDSAEERLIVEVSYPKGTPSFENTFNPAPVSESIVVFKTLIGWRLPEFAFTFGLFDINGVQIETAQNVDGVVRFPQIIYTQPGVYYYTVRELTKSGNGWTTDDRQFPVTVTVSVSETGELISSVAYPLGRPVFVDSYKARPASVSLTATKNTIGATAKPGSFTFSVFDETGALVSNATNEEGGRIIFPPIYFYKPGVYYYVMKETTGAGGWITDPREFPHVITITDDGQGQLVALVTYPMGEPIFYNICNRKTCATIRAQKCVIGSIAGCGLFTFILLDSGGNEVARAVNDSCGQVIFPKIFFTHVGTFTFTIRELQTAMPGWVVDSREFPVKVTVINSGAELSAVVRYPGGFPCFVNRYRALCIRVTRCIQR